MTESAINSIDCRETPREETLSVASQPVEGTTITLEVTSHSAYDYVENASLRLQRCITVTAVEFLQVLCSRIRHLFRKAIEIKVLTLQATNTILTI